MTPKVYQKKGETRRNYLARVMIAYLRECYGTAEETIFYDEAVCDGHCLADDIEAEFDIKDEAEQS
jgi:hypothetical protein